MHGPEHHFLVPAVLLTAYFNLRNQTGKEEKLREARLRAKGIVGGACGFLGACGAAIGVGIFVSLVTDATPMSGNEWALCNSATAGALTRIADAGGPRCCKHNTFLAVESAVEFSFNHLGQPLPIGPIYCPFFRLNRECRGAHCRYFAAGCKLRHDAPPVAEAPRR